jgi:hypothetical protein
MVMLWLGSTGVSSPPLGSLTVHEDPCRGAAARWVGQIPDQRIRKYVQKKRLKALMQQDRSRSRVRKYVTYCPVPPLSRTIPIRLQGGDCTRLTPAERYETLDRLGLARGDPLRAEEAVGAERLGECLVES